MITWLKRKAREWGAEKNIPAVDWKQFEDAGLGAGLRQALANPAFRMAIRVIEDGCPRGIPPAGAQGVDFAYLHGYAVGYVQCLDNLRALAVLRLPDLPPPDYATAGDDFDEAPEEQFSLTK